MFFLEGREHSVFRSRFDDSPIPQALVDHEGRIRMVNHALASLLGRTKEDLLERRPDELLHDSDRGGAAAVEAAANALLTGSQSSAQAERIYAHSSGAPVPVLINLSVIWSDDGRVDGVNGYFQDLRVLRASERRLELQEQFYAALGQRARDAALVLAPDGTLVHASPAVQVMFGYDAEGIVGLDAWGFVHTDDELTTREVFDSVVRDGGSAVAKFRVADAEGRWRWVQSTMTNLLHTPIGGVVSNLVDVTEQLEAEAQLREAQLRNQAIVETAQEGILVVAPDGRTEFANARLAEILGRELSELYETPPSQMLRPHDTVLMQTRLRERQLRGAETYELDYEHPDGSTRRLLIAATPFAFGEGAFFGSLGMISDVTEQRRMEAQLRHAALHDPLTRLPNRTLLADRLQQALVRQEESGGVVSLLFVDLDQFKLVNDCRGHDIGDEVLVAVAQRLCGIVRPQDTVARLGGDEFVVLRADTDAASALADRLLEALAEPIVLDQHRVSVTASVGVASSPPYEGKDLLRYADTAMFAAKSAGRAQVRTFDPALAEESERAFVLASDLRGALEDDGLEMHYQPLVELASGNVIGYEALARWTHPQHGVVPPTVFVTLAEQIGLARSLDRWAIRRAFGDFDGLRQSGRIAAETYVAVNLSAQHLAERELEESIVAATAAAGLLARNICLEITEGAVMRDVAAAARILHSLRDRGYRIAIDDFGTGHSSLAYLRNFPITALKIDRSFIADMTTDEDALAIVTSIAQLAQAIGVEAVAEGVETAEQARQLRYLGCAAGQGWLWSKAMPLDQVPHSPRRFAAPSGALGNGRTLRRPGAEVREEHGLVRMMALQREGASLATIAAALNSEGYTTPTGHRWHPMSVARALRDLLPQAAGL